MSRAAQKILTPAESQAITLDLYRRGLEEHALRWRFGQVTGVRAGCVEGRESDSVFLEDVLAQPGKVVVRDQKGGGSRVSAFCDGFDTSPTRADLLAHAAREGRTSGPLFTRGYYSYYLALRRSAENVGVQRKLGEWHDGKTSWRVTPHTAKYIWVKRCRDAGLSWDLICTMGFKAGTRALWTAIRFYRFLEVDAHADELRAVRIVADAPPRAQRATRAPTMKAPRPARPALAAAPGVGPTTKHAPASASAAVATPSVVAMSL